MILDLKSASMFAFVLSLITALLNLVVLGCCAYQLCYGHQHENKSKHDSKARGLIRKSVITLTLFCSMAVICSTFVAATYAPGALGITPLSAIECITFPKIYSSSYVWAACSLLEFLRVRSDIVADISETSRFMKYLRIGANIMAKAVFCTAILCLVMWGGQIVSFDDAEYCVDTIQVIVVILFAAVTAPVNISFVLLFVIPLIQHTKAMKEDGNSTSNKRHLSLIRVIRRNSILSAIGLISTLFDMTFIAVISAYYHDETYLRVIGIGISSFDLSVNVICMIFMFDQWLPIQLRTKLCKPHPNGTTSTKEGAISPQVNPPIQIIGSSTDDRTNHVSVRTSTQRDLTY